ncbi:MAG: TSUP family transporter [Oscillospiraceae bacterium]|nr:TSUP family transporter [Oscillospiraceae bacterium]
MSYAQTLLIICPLVFFAGVVDSVAGGGGIISLPAYLLAGLPIHTAYGTNKMANCWGTAIAAGKFYKSGNIRLGPALVSAAGALAGSWCGTQLALFLPEKYLQISLMVILPCVAVFLLCNKNFGREQAAEPSFGSGSAVLLCALIGLAIGVYDGFFGPGTGTFLVLAFTGILKMPIIQATGNAKAVNLASNLASLAAYIAGGKVAFAVGIPAALCSIAGNYLGASLAIKKGARFIRPMVITAIALLFGKLLYDLVSGGFSL